MVAVNSASCKLELAGAGAAFSSAPIMSRVPHIHVTVDPERLYEGAAEVLSTIRPGWKLSNVTYKLFTDGITNKLVHCSNGDDVLLIRVYGNNTELLIDRQAEIRNIKLLQKTGFAPELYATFNNGLAYEFAPGVTLDGQSVRDPAVYPLVARRMAEMHAVTCSTEQNPEPMLWRTLCKYLSLLKNGFSDAGKHARFMQEFGGLQKLNEELEDLKRELSSLGSPLVLCHNDLLLANVILNPERNGVVFIDYEYAGINYQAFDIGNHFAEFAGVATVDYSLYPQKQLQCSWLRIYLEELHKHGRALGVGAGAGENKALVVTDNNVERLYVQVNKFALASHFLWGVWALVQSEHSAIHFDFFEYAVIRLSEYFAKKKEFLALTQES